MVGKKLFNDLTALYHDPFNIQFAIDVMSCIICTSRGTQAFVFDKMSFRISRHKYIHKHIHVCVSATRNLHFYRHADKQTCGHCSNDRWLPWLDIGTSEWQRQDRHAARTHLAAQG